jgi:hypothetical protein
VTREVIQDHTDPPDVLGPSGTRRTARTLLSRLIVMTSGLVVGGLLAEGLLRAGIYFNVAHLRRPELYADDLADDDYWKLTFQWQRQYRHVPRADDRAGVGHSASWVDPDLGWAPPATPDNPLGAWMDNGAMPDPAVPSIVFYGDSFVQGATKRELAIPQQLEHDLPGRHVYNLGVGSYGIDQIFLRFKKTYRRFGHPTVLFGILTEDIDRAVLDVRTGPKPRFVLGADGQLVLTGVPVSSDPMTWFAANPPTIRSYVFALAIRQARLAAGTGERLGVQWKRREKEVVAAKIIEEAVREARSTDTPLIFVIFYGLAALQHPDWREVFLRQHFDALHAAFVDTRPLLMEASRREGVDVTAYYRRDTHHNREGNAIIAAGIADYVHAPARRGRVAAASGRGSPQRGSSPPAARSRAGASAPDCRASVPPRRHGTSGYTRRQRQTWACNGRPRARVSAVGLAGRDEPIPRTSLCRERL